MVVHAFNPSADEADGGTSLWVWGLPDLHNKLQTTQVRPCLKKETITIISRYLLVFTHNSHAINFLGDMQCQMK